MKLSIKKESLYLLSAIIFISFLLLTAFAINTVYANTEQEIRIIINDEELKTDVKPLIIEGRTMVPLRAIFESLDSTVDWIPETRTIIGKKEDIAIILQLDNKIAKVNDKEVMLDVAATAIEERTLVPLRFIAESIQAEVEWEEHTRTVIISSKTDVNQKNDENIVNLNSEKISEVKQKLLKENLTQLTLLERSDYSRTDEGVTQFLHEQLQSYGYEIQEQLFYLYEGTMPYMKIEIPVLSPFAPNDNSYEKVGEGMNIIAVKKGNSNQSPILILSAHYDYNGGTGAVDNGTGVSALLELARILAPLDTDLEIRFCFFDVEEEGPAGSQYYVNNLTDEEKERIIANITLDILSEIGYNESDIIIASENDYTAVNILKTVESLKDTEVNINPRTISDNVSFSEAGIPSALFTNFYISQYTQRAHELYLQGVSIYVPVFNTEDDTIDKVDFNILEQKTNWILQAILNLENNIK